jgi:hypothetical protein
MILVFTILCNPNPADRNGRDVDYHHSGY